VVEAYVLIQTEVGKSKQVLEEVRHIKGVTQADDVTGPYDIVVRLGAENVDRLGGLVVTELQSIDGITRTLTCPVINL